MVIRQATGEKAKSDKKQRSTLLESKRVGQLGKQFVTLMRMNYEFLTIVGGHERGKSFKERKVVEICARVSLLKVLRKFCGNLINRVGVKNCNRVGGEGINPVAHRWLGHLEDCVVVDGSGGGEVVIRDSVDGYPDGFWFPGSGCLRGSERYE